MSVFLKNKIRIAGLILISFLIILSAYILVLWPGDVSADRVENRHIFGSTFMTMNNPYYDVLSRRLQMEIEERGDVLLSRDAAMSQDRQNEEIMDLIDAGAELIFLTPVEWDTSRRGIREAKKAGVPVIVVDAPVQDTRDVTCSVISDNYKAGTLCAEHLMANRDSAKILLLEHFTAHSGTERIQGFCDAIRDRKGFEILDAGESDGQIENAMPVMERLLKKHPDADVVMALNDPSAFGAMAAIEGSGLDQPFFVYSVDGSPEAKAMIAEGRMTATCAQFPYRIVEEAVRIAYDALYKRKVPREIIVPVELITEKNVEEYGTAGWQ